eukprot:676637-Rhodomonas_salina.2
MHQIHWLCAMFSNRLGERECSQQVSLIEGDKSRVRDEIEGDRRHDCKFVGGFVVCIDAQTIWCDGAAIALDGPTWSTADRHCQLHSHARYLARPGPQVATEGLPPSVPLLQEHDRLGGVQYLPVVEHAEHLRVKAHEQLQKHLLSQVVQLGLFHPGPGHAL